MPPIGPSPQNPWGGTAQPEPELDIEVDFSEWAKVEAWRYEQLVVAGWPHTLATLLAAEHTVDLHRACDLLRNGCEPGRAFDLLV